MKKVIFLSKAYMTEGRKISDLPIMYFMSQRDLFDFAQPNFDPDIFLSTFSKFKTYCTLKKKYISMLRTRYNREGQELSCCFGEHI